VLSNTTTKRLARRLAEFLNSVGEPVEDIEGWSGFAAPVIWDGPRLRRETAGLLELFVELAPERAERTRAQMTKRRAAAARFFDRWTSDNPTQGFVCFRDNKLVLSKPLFGGVNEAVAVTLMMLAEDQPAAEVYKCRRVRCERFIYRDNGHPGKPQLYCHVRCKKKSYREENAK
jgi:hypothetical protein